MGTIIKIPAPKSGHPLGGEGSRKVDLIVLSTRQMFDCTELRILRNSNLLFNKRYIRTDFFCFLSWVGFPSTVKACRKGASDTFHGP